MACIFLQKIKYRGKKREIVKNPTYHYGSMVFNTMPIYLFSFENTFLRHVPFDQYGNQFNVMRRHTCNFVRIEKKDITL